METHFSSSTLCLFHKLQTAVKIAMAYADTGLMDSLMTLVVPPPLTSVPDDSGSLSFSDEGFTALHYACRFAGHDVLKTLLLRKDVDINATDAKGESCLPCRDTRSLIHKLTTMLLCVVFYLL